MTAYEETRQRSGFKNRSTGLALFGVLQIILGGLCALAIPSMLFGIIASATLDNRFATPMSARTAIPGLLFYLLIAMWFISMGIGSMRARRWARALTLVFSWIWLITGVIGFVFVGLLMPDMFEQMSRGGQIPQEIAVIMTYVVIAFMTVIYIIIPGVFVLFYGSKNVKMTCEVQDPRVRWTDKIPLPVLALTLIFAFGGFCMPMMVFYGSVVPVFGRLVNGIPGALILLFIALTLAFLARGTYTLRTSAWWGAFVLSTLGGMTTIITFLRVNLMEFYERMNFPVQQMEIMQQVSLPANTSLAVCTALWIIAFLGYLLYTRRYFVGVSLRR
jgi:hypothetical protein